MNIQEQVPLAPYTTFKIGGMARFFCVCKSIHELQDAIAFAQVKNVPIFILGGGSNVLISDQGFDGLVIKIELHGITEMPVEQEAHLVRVIAAAGEVWDTLVAHTVARNLYGLENLSLIPGTVGAVPVQNIGAYGVEAKDTIEWVEVFDPATSSIRLFSNEDCQFGYRSSYFKHAGKGLVITRVSFVLSRTPKLSTTYKDLELYFAEQKDRPTLESLRQAVIEIRTRKLPDLAKFGTAGSFFKNPIITRAAYDVLLKQYPTMPSFVIDGDDHHVKVPAGWILDKICDAKGRRFGQNNAVGSYEQQALVLVNFGQGTAAQVQAFADSLIAEVQSKTSIILEREVEYIGKF